MQAEGTAKKATKRGYKEKKSKAHVAGLPRGLNVYPGANGAGQVLWRVRIGPSFKKAHKIKEEKGREGKVEVRSFSTLHEARDCAYRLIAHKKIHGDGGFNVSQAELTEAKRAFSTLEGKGLDEKFLQTAVEYYLERVRPGEAVKTWGMVATAYLKELQRTGAKESTITSYKSYLRIIGERWNSVPITEITKKDLEGWLASPPPLPPKAAAAEDPARKIVESFIGRPLPPAQSDGEDEPLLRYWGPRTKNNYRLTLSTVFNFAIREEFCVENPAARIKKFALDETVVGVLTPSQAHRLLEVALEERPDMVPAIAIALFSGLRRSEICALSWEDIDLDARFITVTAAHAKTRHARYPSISDNLLAWLRVFTPSTGAVTPHRNLDVYGGILNRLVEGRPASDGDKGRAPIVDVWPQNAMRHSFATYLYGLKGHSEASAAGVAKEMGNTEEVVFEHYRKPVPPTVAEQYWAIMPPAHYRYRIAIGNVTFTHWDLVQGLAAFEGRLALEGVKERSIDKWILDHAKDIAEVLTSDTIKGTNMLARGLTHRAGTGPYIKDQMNLLLGKPVAKAPGGRPRSLPWSKPR